MDLIIKLLHYQMEEIIHLSNQAGIIEIEH